MNRNDFATRQFRAVIENRARELFAENDALKKYCRELEAELTRKTVHLHQAVLSWLLLVIALSMVFGIWILK